ncbi:MAG: FapA family protein [Bacillota bacterium]
MARVWVEDGKVRVEHPEGGPYPVVLPGPGMLLYVNGQLQAGPVEVKATDQVEVRLRDEERAGAWRLEITPDGMEAAVIVSMAVTVRRRLRDLPPSPRLQLQVEEEIRTRSPLEPGELRTALARAGVVYGIDEQAVDRVGDLTRDTRLVVARGKPLVPPQDARVEHFFSPEERLPVSYGEAAADLRLRFTFTSVAPGELLARRHPPIPGEPGTTVRGEAVPVKAPRDLVLVAGRGAELSQDGQEVRATSCGRPMSVRKGDRVQVYVVSELVHPRDVDLSTGHVHFKGDVKVGGSVLEGMEIMALGTVEIGGSAVGARVVGGGGVKVGRGVISSTVVAGQRPGWLSAVLPLLTGVVKDLGDLGAALSQLWEAGEVLPGPALRLLLESSRFGQLGSRVGQLTSQYMSVPIRERDEDLAAALKRLQRLLSAPMGLRDPQELFGLLRALQERGMELEGMNQETAPLRCGYAMNSTLQATGDILVAGDGCHSTRLVAGGSVRVEKVFRGGEIQAGREVWVGELGAPGIPTRVRVPHSGQVKLRRVAEDSVVQVGDRVYQFLKEEQKVGLRLNSESQLEFFW